MLRGTTVPSDTWEYNLTPSPAWADSLETMAPNVTGLVQAQQTSGETWYDALARLLPVLATTYQQKQLLSVQVERARAGLPPLDVEQYAPGANVNVGLSPDLQRLLIVGGVVALGLLAYGSLRRRS